MLRQGWFFSSLLISTLLLSGCVAAVVGGSAATTAWVAQDKRTTGTVIDDQTIEMKIQHEIGEYEFLNLNANAHLVIVSYNNIVLLVGQVPSSGAKEQIAKIARDTQKVRKVHDELTIQEPISLATRSKDSWITTKIKASSGFNEINPLHTKVITENSVVYLMGIVTRAQADQLTELARSTSGVARVVRVFEYVD
jgi:osmotically-inducible protein OsmY